GCSVAGKGPRHAMTDAPEALPYRVLARKYRPTSFQTLIGQEAMVRTLRNAIESGRLAHAFMLTGVRGVGKTTTARIIARALNCIGPDGKGSETVEPCGVCENCLAIAEDRHMDVIEMDAASRTGIADIRELIEGVRFKPASARYKVYIIDEVHMLSNQAFNGLLKTLEEPPPHVKFIFATTEIRKVPVTVLSRCQRFDLRRIDIDTLAAHFTKIAQTEKVEIAPEAIAMVARAADGSVRDGLSLLDQAIAHGGGVVSADQVRDMLGLADRGRIFDLFDSLMSGDIQSALAVLDDLYNAGADPVVVMQDLLDLTHWLTRLKLVPDAGSSALTPEAERVRGRAMAEKLAMPILARTWQMLMKGLQETQSAPSPIRAAEMALVRLAYAADLPSPGDALRALEKSGGAPAPSPRANGSAAPSSGGATNAVGRSSSAPAPSGGPSASAGLAVVARSEQPQPLARAPQPDLPATAEAVLALLEDKREMMLANQFLNNVHVVSCEAGRLEFRPAPTAPADLANRLGETLLRLTGQRWMISVSREAGQPTIAAARAAEESARRASAASHPLVQAVLEVFPGAAIERIRKLQSDEALAADAATEEDDFGYDAPLGEDEL
ncbi:MAG: DNA polymerase III subunit gamma/tau, partial [Reyranellaceae bacterium]